MTTYATMAASIAVWITTTGGLDYRAGDKGQRQGSRRCWVAMHELSVSNS